MPEIIARKNAIALGFNKYFTGKTCNKGHISERYCKNGACQECLRPATSLVRRTIEGQVVSASDPRIEILNRGLAVKEAEIENERRRIALKEQSFALKSQMVESQIERRSAAQIERRARREKNLYIKENLITFKMLADEEDHPVAVNMVWMAALMRNPEITKADVITGRQLDRYRHVMRCFPADQGMLLRETNRLYDQKYSVATAQARQQAIGSAQVAEAAEIESEWPELKA